MLNMIDRHISYLLQTISQSQAYYAGTNDDDWFFKRHDEKLDDTSPSHGMRLCPGPSVYIAPETACCRVLHQRWLPEARCDVISAAPLRCSATCNDVDRPVLLDVDVDVASKVFARSGEDHRRKVVM